MSSRNLSQRGTNPPRGAGRTVGRTRERTRSVEATTIGSARARSLGVDRPEYRRSYGRGETASRVEEERLNAVRARSAVYTRENRRQSRLPDASPMILPLIIIAVLIVSAFILAGPVCTLYAAWRDAGIVEAEYDALVEQNQELQGRLDDLNSLPGIEDEARRRGYAYPDEEALIVDNLEQEILADPAKVDEAIAEHEANMPWYVDVLDTLLGYEAKVD